MNSELVAQMIRAGMPDAEVTVTGADGVHFEAHIISASFAGKTTLQRHRAVYATLGEFMGREIHALALRTDVPQSGK
jgi:acid stress-induced BolA-like protein IbaG/YrbA